MKGASQNPVRRQFQTLHQTEFPIEERRLFGCHCLPECFDLGFVLALIGMRAFHRDQIDPLKRHDALARQIEFRAMGSLVKSAHMSSSRTIGQ
ncbi:hypothetical protein D8780_07880 [Notoacmeibacter ruber]|uniref:Uncharacterized protein n=1 Tax=Notoacmeibacter ruber TaxID=2670375 RepID=A0A3L7JEX8_9HYPH|nr:hypothetical protein D8780_07880 [Notoacmeibacter ruber]